MRENVRNVKKSSLFYIQILNAFFCVFSQGMSLICEKSIWTIRISIFLHKSDWIYHSTLVFFFFFFTASKTHCHFSAQFSALFQLLLLKAFFILYIWRGGLFFFFFLSDKLQHCTIFNFISSHLDTVITWNFSGYGTLPVLWGHPNTQQTVVIKASSVNYFMQPGKNTVEYQRDINISVCQEWQIWFKAGPEDCK